MLLRQWPDGDLWYMKDDKFKRPKAIINLKLYSNDCMFGRTAQSRVFVEVWKNVVKEYLREFYYMASMAELEACMVIYHDNFNIEWRGYDDSLPTFVEETLKRIKNMNINEQKESFDQVKEKLQQEWHNFYYEQSFRQALAAFDTVVINNSFEKNVQKKILDSYSFEDFVSQAHDWLKTGRLVMFVHGNIDKEVTSLIMEKTRETLALKAADKEDLVDIRTIALPPNSSYLLESPLVDRSNENSCLISYFEAGLEGNNIRKKLIH